MVNTFHPKTSKPAKGSVTYVSTYLLDGREYAINTWNGQYGIREDILHPMIRQMEAMLSYHSKVYQIRLEAHSKDYDGENKSFTADIHRLIKWLKGKGHKRVSYCWVREKDRSKNYHYHIVIWLNGHLIRSPDSVYRRWDAILGANQKWVRSTPMILRSKSETQSGAIYTASYLAKERTKGYGDKGTRDFSTSQLKRNVDIQEIGNEFTKKIA
ncbi:inovirus-type Gp2 protein [Marinobacterium sp. xm-m-312]|uniref:rolling circle replication-associated protein n=1 Tax=Marinobacterium sp. xm-m-312 TaxID=2497741 RepID=UPI00156A1BE8|nr:inovirus-type Gp2 protein [Marinobacterium sp. xm-m-312]NRQ22736.1 hypothetical protein [Marinobacterium sp. xm-m-312]